MSEELFDFAEDILTHQGVESSKHRFIFKQ